ncbi:MAG TPA: ATP-binding cassette domain-containing protein [Candidatus Paceibacterota bacterium]
MSAIIEVKHLTKKFDDGTVAVDDISFSVEQGSIFAFLGPNGAGKSTTIKMLTTILHPTEGVVHVGGADVHENPSEARRAFGIVFQDPSLDDELTAYENLDFHGALYGISKKEREKRIDDMFEFVELSNRRDSLVKEFSGGMKRRLEIARGLLHHPRVLFLDEPTLGLDPQTRNHLWRYIADLNASEGITVFFTTHYLEEAERIANKTAIIDHGKIIASGTVEELKQNTGAATLEEAYLSLTGKSIREEEGSARDHMRAMHRAWRGGRR